MHQLSMQKRKNPSVVNQLLSQIQELQDKVNSLNEEKLFYDPETPNSPGMSHVPSQPSRIPSPRGVTSSDPGLPFNTRFEDLPAPEGPSPSFFRIPRNLTSLRIEIR